MASDHYISVREAAIALCVSERKIMDLVESGKLQAYRIAGQFLRLKQSEVFDIKKSAQIPVENALLEYTSSERLRDFFYFNDFYIISSLIIIALMYIVFMT